MPRIQELYDTEGVSLRYENALHSTVVIFERKDPFADVPASSSKGPDEVSNGEQNPPATASKHGNTLLGLSINERAVYDFLQFHPSTSAEEISSETGIPRRTLADILKRLRNKSLISVNGSNRSTTYSLTESDN